MPHKPKSKTRYSNFSSSLQALFFSFFKIYTYFFLFLDSFFLVPSSVCIFFFVLSYHRFIDMYREIKIPDVMCVCTHRPLKKKVKKKRPFRLLPQNPLAPLVFIFYSTFLRRDPKKSLFSLTYTTQLYRFLFFFFSISYFFFFLLFFLLFLFIFYMYVLFFIREQWWIYLALAF